MDTQSISDAITQLHWVDQVGIGVSAVFLALGLWRGLWWQVLRLVALLASISVARWVGPVWGDAIYSWGDIPMEVAQGLGWASGFLLTMLGIAVLGMLGNRTIEAMKLGLINRMSGAVAGLATGVLLHCAGVWACSSFASQEWRSEVLSATWTSTAIEKLTELTKAFPA